MEKSGITGAAVSWSVDPSHVDARKSSVFKFRTDPLVLISPQYRVNNLGTSCSDILVQRHRGCQHWGGMGKWSIQPDSYLTQLKASISQARTVFQTLLSVSTDCKATAYTEWKNLYREKNQGSLQKSMLFFNGGINCA